MGDLTKEDQAAIDRLVISVMSKAKGFHSKENFKDGLRLGAQAACAYKQKRITELEAVIKTVKKRLCDSPAIIDTVWADDMVTLYDLCDSVLKEGGGDDSHGR